MPPMACDVMHVQGCQTGGLRAICYPNILYFRVPGNIRDLGVFLAYFKEFRTRDIFNLATFFAFFRSLSVHSLFYSPINMKVLVKNPQFLLLKIYFYNTEIIQYAQYSAPYVNNKARF